MTQAEIKWLTEDEQRTWRAFIGAYTRLHAKLDAELLASSSLTLGEYEVMAHLSESPRWELRMNDLAERCGLSPSGLTRRFDGMARQNLVERRRCAEDRRGVLAVLTPTGFERLTATAPAHVASVRRHFVDHLTPDEMVVLADVFGRVVANGAESHAR